MQKTTFYVTLKLYEIKQYMLYRQFSYKNNNRDIKHFRIKSGMFQVNICATYNVLNNTSV